MSLFDLEDDKGTKIGTVNKLDVVKLDYVGAESLSWQDLFSGFDHLYAITFSSGVNFVYSLLSMFKTADIIFGCEAVLSYSMHEILAYQSELIERLRKGQSKSKVDLLNRLDDKTVHFSVARKQISHEKVYLLESDDGRKRVIMGSANMSYNAFSGSQRENICYIDGESAFSWYMDVFNSLKRDCTDTITRKAIELSDLGENLDELPVAQSVKANRVISIQETHDNDEEIQFILDVKKAAQKIKPSMPVSKQKSDKIIISTDTIVKLKRQLQVEKVKEKELRS